MLSYKGDVLTEPEEVKGYNKLNAEHKKLFEKFLKNYYEVWEFPEEHLPIKVRYVTGRESYLRVDFKSGWLHVLSQTCWF